jgi:hypothetical protein
MQVQMAKFYKDRFCTFSTIFFERASQKAKEASVLDWGDLEFNDFESMDNVFASNLIYSMDDFSNVFYVDRIIILIFLVFLC